MWACETHRARQSPDSVGDWPRGALIRPPSFDRSICGFSNFIRKVEVIFHPDEAGRERDDLSDGQRSSRNSTSTIILPS